MAKEIDLESQEQIDALKHFWDRYGTLITVVVVLVAAVFFGTDYYRKYQDEQAVKASVLYGQMQLAVEAADLDKVERVLADMQQRYADTTYAEQAAFLAGSTLAAKGHNDRAKQAVQWVLDNSDNDGYKAVAKLRLSALAVSQDDIDGAMKWLQSGFPASFQPLVDDRTGDVLALQDKTDEAVAAYQKAYDNMDEKIVYRQVIGIKLTALGASPDGLPESDAPEADSAAGESSTSEPSENQGSAIDTESASTQSSDTASEGVETVSTGSVDGADEVKPQAPATSEAESALEEAEGSAEIEKKAEPEPSS